jgi:hypothetical protein
MWTVQCGGFRTCGLACVEIRCECCSRVVQVVRVVRVVVVVQE